MSEEWEFYFTRVNDSFASILVDVGLRDTVPDPARTWLLRLWVHFRQVDADGFPGEEESIQFAEIEQAIIQEVTGSLDAVLAGRVTTAGRREFFCYAPSFAGFEDAAARCMNRFSGYKWDVETELDPDWEHYLGLLYPSTRDWQQIQNRQVIEQLSQHGDSLEQKRMVFHWAYFPSEALRSQFEADLKQRGFEVTDWSTDDSPDEVNLYGIGFERIDHVNWESINQVTLELLELAESHSGNYDGWETTVEGVEP